MSDLLLAYLPASQSASQPAPIAADAAVAAGSGTDKIATMPRAELAKRTETSPLTWLLRLKRDARSVDQSDGRTGGLW